MWRTSLNFTGIVRKMLLVGALFLTLWWFSQKKKICLFMHIAIYSNREIKYFNDWAVLYCLSLLLLLFFFAKRKRLIRSDHLGWHCTLPSMTSMTTICNKGVIACDVHLHCDMHINWSAVVLFTISTKEVNVIIPKEFNFKYLKSCLWLTEKWNRS